MASTQLAGSRAFARPCPAHSHAIRRWSGAALGPQLLQRREPAAICRAYSPKEPELGDRVIASIPFLVPLMDILPYGG